MKTDNTAAAISPQEILYSYNTPHPELQKATKTQTHTPANIPSYNTNTSKMVVCIAMMQSPEISTFFSKKKTPTPTHKLTFTAMKPKNCTPGYFFVFFNRKKNSLSCRQRPREIPSSRTLLLSGPATLSTAAPSAPAVPKISAPTWSGRLARLFHCCFNNGTRSNFAGVWKRKTGSLVSMVLIYLSMYS